MTFLHSPAKILAQFLVNEGLGVFGTGSWPITYGALPDDAIDGRIATFNIPSETMGKDSRDGELVIFPGVQIRTRSRDENTAYSKLALIEERLLQIRPRACEVVSFSNPTFEVGIYNVRVQIPIFQLDGVEEKNKRFNYVLSVNLTLGET